MQGDGYSCPEKAKSEILGFIQYPGASIGTNVMTSCSAWSRVTDAGCFPWSYELLGPPGHGAAEPTRSLRQFVAAGLLEVRTPNFRAQLDAPPAIACLRARLFWTGYLQTIKNR